MVASKRASSRARSTEPTTTTTTTHSGEENEMLSLRRRASKIQDAIDHCRHGILQSHIEFPKKEDGVTMETLLEYARRVAYTTSAPLNYQPGVSQLCGQLPPAPQEEHFLVSQLKKRHEETLVQEQALARKRQREEEMQQRQKEIEEMAKLPKEELIRRLMQWKPGQPWPSGVPKPPVGWKPGDPLAFLAEAPEKPTSVAEKQPSNVAAEEKKQEKQQQQHQLSLDFGDDDADDEEDFDDDAFDFDVVSASDGDDFESD